MCMIDKVFHKEEARFNEGLNEGPALKVMVKEAVVKKQVHA